MRNYFSKKFKKKKSPNHSEEEQELKIMLSTLRSVAKKKKKAQCKERIFPMKNQFTYTYLILLVIKLSMQKYFALGGILRKVLSAKQKFVSQQNS